MNQRDRDLLNKQFAWMRPAPRQISLKVGVTSAIFIAGLGISSMLVLKDPNSTEAVVSTSAQSAILAAYDAGRRAY